MVKRISVKRVVFSIYNWCLVFGCLHPVIIDCAICCESTKDLGFGVFKEFGLSGLGLVRFHNEEQEVDTCLYRLYQYLDVLGREMYLQPITGCDNRLNS